MSTEISDNLFISLDRRGATASGGETVLRLPLVDIKSIDKLLGGGAIIRRNKDIGDWSCCETYKEVCDKIKAVL